MTTRSTGPTRPKKTPAVLVVLGSILSFGPVLGILCTIIAMVSAFQTIGGQGVEKPEALAEEMGFALTSTAIGILLLPIGVILLVIGIRGMIKQQKREEN
ncbi:hypothetical protein PDESU_06455 [Pontiella desulfatans]|uniref:MotA/TolQ/ExbB proton channel domain-containing protein n=1 Tax=Pontiella desulfatans TaxID=2750659 RepID=A0A6C2UDD2_PONDE|nr:MotA/TolQ/ExbB proton channel family protein [Pontiella desulfatans]VGO17853.1 hypothetical protein PDESU_06455 [Pontiella desulfatans]